MASVDTLARGTVVLTPQDVQTFYRAEGIESFRRPLVDYAVDFLLVGQDYDLNRNQVLCTCVGNGGFWPVVTAQVVGDRIAFRIAAEFPGVPGGIASVYFHVLENIAGIAAVSIPAV